MVEPFREQLPRLRAERGWSREALSHRAFAIKQEGTSVAQITAIERGSRYPSAATIAALATALELAPETFAEYRLAIARRALDDRVIGLNQAVANLDRLVEALPPAEAAEPPLAEDLALVERATRAAAEDQQRREQERAVGDED